MFMTTPRFETTTDDQNPPVIHEEPAAEETNDASKEVTETLKATDLNDASSAPTVGDSTDAKDEENVTQTPAPAEVEVQAKDEEEANDEDEADDNVEVVSQENTGGTQSVGNYSGYAKSRFTKYGRTAPKPTVTTQNNAQNEQTNSYSPPIGRR
jgi:hypothetical protein